MSEIIDVANEATEQFLSVAIQNRPRPFMPFTGYCYNCDEPIERGNYCDAECRHDHEMRIRAERQSGRM